MSKLLYQGHGSLRITSGDGIVIYIDPYVGEGYDVPADYILVTHEHSDHNKIERVNRKPNCRVVRSRNVNIGGNYATLLLGKNEVRAVPAYNKNHDKNECVGFLITLDDGIVVYVAGDTSTTDFMKELAKRKIDYALFPCDGVYNMGAKEATTCADLVGAKHSIPYHTKPGELFDDDVAANFTVKTRLIVHPGEEIALTK